ncbi:hypothetical protein HanIR_Chr12g0573981 [Helianthus annuus]|nr:hypothetical protein HanIR_Chr12g0573981 [Helianthus annuus]
MKISMQVFGLLVTNGLISLSLFHAGCLGIEGSHFYLLCLCLHLHITALIFLLHV